MEKVYIKRIEWLDVDSKEALIVISDGVYNLNCFSDFCKYTENDLILSEINALSIKNIMKSDVNSFRLSQDRYRFDCIINGKISNQRKVLEIGNIKIKIDNEKIPNDIVDGEYVNVYISRVDIWD